MQTLSEIRALLAAHGLTPRHRFGQNFLIDLNLMRKLVTAAEIHPLDAILEVGPGAGSLTEALLESGARVASVEIDRGLCHLLRGRLGEHPRFTLIEGDALQSKNAINAEALHWLRSAIPEETQTAPAAPRGARKLVANLPYQIATPLLMELLLAGDPPAHAELGGAWRPLLERLVCTIQKEVGERFLAAAGTEAYGPVSVIAQSLATIETIAVLPPTAFWPAPKVHSVMLRIRPLPTPTTHDPAGLAGFVQRAFQQRRKTLGRVTREWKEFDASAFERTGISPTLRPEQLDPSAWRSLFQAQGRP